MRKHGLACRQPDRRPTSSPPTAGSCTRARTRTPTCSGACAAAAATSASSPRSSTGCTRSARRSPAAPVFYPGERAGEVLRVYRELGRHGARRADDARQPADRARRRRSCPRSGTASPLVAVIGVHAGPGRGRRARDAAAARARRAGRGPVRPDALRRRCRACIDPLWGPGAHNYLRPGCLRGLDDAAIDTLVGPARRASPRPRPRSTSTTSAARSPACAPDATAFGERSAPFLLNIVASTFTADGYDDAVDWAQAAHAALGAGADRRRVRELPLRRGRGRASAPPTARTTYDRLVALKDEYDPTNVFRLNQNVQPSA